jgi:hypothetical protein
VTARPSRTEPRWLLAHPLELLVVVLTPPFPRASLQTLRVVRLLRLLRLPSARAQIACRSFSLVGLRYAAVLALITAIRGRRRVSRDSPPASRSST